VGDDGGRMGDDGAHDGRRIKDDDDGRRRERGMM